MEVVVLQGYWHWCNHRSEVETLLFCGCFGVLCRERLGQLGSRQWWLCSVVLNHFPTLEIRKSSMKGRMVPFIFSALLTVCRSASENRLDDCKVELNQQLLKDVLPFLGLVQEVQVPPAAPLLMKELGHGRLGIPDTCIFPSQRPCCEYFLSSPDFWACSGLGCSDRTRGSALSPLPSVWRPLTMPYEADDCCVVFNTSGF